MDGLNVATDVFAEEIVDGAALQGPPADLIYLPNNPYTPEQLFFINTAQV